MKLDTLHRLISSPAWVPQASLLPTDPKLIADLHQALVDGAFAPCPPTVSTPEGDEDTVPAADNLELETQLATLRQLQELLPDLDLTVADLPPLTEKLPKNQRESSAKFTRKTSPRTEKSQHKQEVAQNVKNIPKNPECAPKTTAPAPSLPPPPQSPLRTPKSLLRKPKTATRNVFPACRHFGYRPASCQVAV